MGLSTFSQSGFLLESSPQFLPRVKRLIISVYSEDSLSLFCKSLMNNSSVHDLDLDFYDFRPSHANDLGDMFTTNRTLKRIKLRDHTCSLHNSDLLRLFTSLSKSSSTQEADVSLKSQEKGDSSVVVPLFSSENLKSLTITRYESLDSRVLVALENNSSLKEVTMLCTDFCTELLANVFKVNTVLKSLFITEGSSSLLSVCKALESNTTLHTLVISHGKQNPSEQETIALAEMLEKNTGLTSFCFSPFECQTFLFAPIFQGLQQNSTLCKFYMIHLKFSSLIKCFEVIYSNSYNCNLDFLPHSLDISTGTIDYQYLLNEDDIGVLLNALKSNLPIKRVKCRGWQNPSLAKILEFIEVFTIYNSVIDFNISPHFVNIDDGEFCFSPSIHTDVSAEDIASLQSILQSNHDIESLILKKCRFSENAINSLRDLFRVNTTLFSVEFDDCKLSDDDVLKIFADIQSTSCLHYISLDKNSLTFKTLVGIFQLATSANSMICGVVVPPHSINRHQGLISYENQVTDVELALLLDALKADVPIMSVECRDIEHQSFLSVLYYIQIRCMYRSVIDLCFFPNVFSFRKREFSYFPQTLWPTITAGEISSLQSFLVSVKVKNFHLLDVVLLTTMHSTVYVI
ncbi:hypothetical protein GEMRC1_006772 [Eukaryota sp. GEM-RC1]